MLGTLVVGLGGTGSATLAYLKQRLLTDQHWVQLERDPSAIASPQYASYTGTVALRALDVDRQHRPRTPDGVQLDSASEDIALSAPIGRVVEDIQNSQATSRTWPTMQQWLPRDEALKFELVDAVRFMTEGAAIRQFGRIAFFLDQLQGAPQLQRIVSALTRLTRTDPGTQGVDLQVFVVGSVAGGAGAGLLIDVLTYLQYARRQTAGQVSVRTIAYVVLPGAFGGVVTGDSREQMSAGSRAALRELDRLINAYRTIRIEWLPGQPVTLETPVADVCYLVDGSRDLASQAPQLEGHAPFENGLPVAIADALYAHVFPSSGAIFTRDYPNLTQELLGGTKARYSSFGSYSINYAWEPLTRSFALRATGEMIDRLLASNEGEGRRGVDQFLAAGATGALAAGDKQQSLPSFPTDALGQNLKASSLLPVAAWLLPHEHPASQPPLPNLFDHFPGLGRWRTEYENPDAVAQAQGLIDEFWGNRQGTWNGWQDQGSTRQQTTTQRRAPRSGKGRFTSPRPRCLTASVRSVVSALPRHCSSPSWLVSSSSPSTLPSSPR